MADEPEPKRVKLNDHHVDGQATVPPADTAEKEEDEGDEDGVPAEEEEEAETPLACFTKETDVGIEQYLSSSHKGFFAILKQRYSDFQVHERKPDGSVIHLTNCSVPCELLADKGTVSLETVFSAEEVEKLTELSEAGEEGSGSVHIEAGENKDHRTKQHMAIRQHFPSLDSKTSVESVGGAKKTIISVTKGARGRGPQQRSHWPRDRPDYCWFVMYKENRDTLEAINLLSSLIRIKSSMFQYAGTKDKRAITTQAVTVFRVPAERLVSLNRASKNVQVGNFEYVKEPLRLGSLAGNHFTVVLRKVRCDDDDVIGVAMASLRDTGFINYYGMQRFGTSTIPTHHVGRCLLHCDWQGAVDLILKPRPGEPEPLDKARRHYAETRDPASTLAMLPRRRCVEGKLLWGLKERSGTNDLQGAFNFIPRNTRLMYVHSYQSYVWNKMASWRIAHLGLTPVPGDLVWTRGDSRHKEVDNKVGEEYIKLLQQDGLSIEMLRHRVKDYALPGDYRSLVLKPENVQWRSFDYDDIMQPLILSDLDTLEAKPAPVSLPGGQYRALSVEFSLPPSSYATMAIREVLRMDTSSHHQAQLDTSSSRPISRVGSAI
ncbi:hypothetical protein EMCRGX_G002901 [Ephydatia muelleri]